MKNLEIAQIFYQIAEFIEMNEVSFRSRAYNKAARVLESMEINIEEIYNQGGLKELKKISGIGQATAQKIEEFIKTGKIKTYQKLKKECPVDLEKLTAVEGLGARKIKVLYKELSIRNLKDLEKAAKTGKIGGLEGFGQKSETNILEAIEFVKAGQGRFPLGTALSIIRQIINKLEKLSEVKKISSAGSLRRMKETIGDLDILVISSQPKKVMNFFVKMPEVIKIWAQGLTKSSVRLKNGLDCDLRVVKKESFGAALQYFTGSKEHNILVRKIAKKKKLKLNEYGVFLIKEKTPTQGRGPDHEMRRERIAGKSEKEVYNAIGLPYIEPELRTNTGEIEAALNNKLPELIGYKDIKGETHSHSDWSDGDEKIEDLAKAAKKMGYQYIVLTDHAGFLKITNALDEKRLLKQMDEIDKINKKLSGIKIIKGAEVDIKVDGSLAIKDEVLAKLDFVYGAIHSKFKMSKKDMTQRLIRAIENPHLDAIAHPTGRMIQKREEYLLDFEQILKVAKKNRTALEINAHAKRLDLKDIYIRQAVEMSVKMVIGTDVHHLSYMPMMELGIAQARRGWASKKDILNTRSFIEFIKYFK
ncbi:DNA polymerase/3'-5' exonuclease PolX [Patescibacteria group bacterium]|nr:DNA polymerase/3'-5' exonuclease PolX [Patescibacteria group bacterium]MBU1563583.1 DNA polymerase/3'-5' exonuclease PolX [Patescibacteria group bacterium]